MRSACFPVLSQQRLRLPSLCCGLALSFTKNVHVPLESYTEFVDHHHKSDELLGFYGSISWFTGDDMSPVHSLNFAASVLFDGNPAARASLPTYDPAVSAPSFNSKPWASLLLPHDLEDLCFPTRRSCPTASSRWSDPLRPLWTNNDSALREHNSSSPTSRNGKSPRP